MRTPNFGSIALLALSLSSGCALAVGPAAGAGVGLVIGGAKKAQHKDASLISYGTVGALIGAAVEAVVVGAMLYKLSNEHWDLGDDRTAAARRSTR